MYAIRKKKKLQRETETKKRIKNKPIKGKKKDPNNMDRANNVGS